jgi:hypothetical protein
MQKTRRAPESRFDSVLPKPKTLAMPRQWRAEFPCRVTCFGTEASFVKKETNGPKLHGKETNGPIRHNVHRNAKENDKSTRKWRFCRGSLPRLHFGTEATFVKKETNVPNRQDCLRFGTEACRWRTKRHNNGSRACFLMKFCILPPWSYPINTPLCLRVEGMPLGGQKSRFLERIWGQRLVVLESN